MRDHSLPESFMQRILLAFLNSMRALKHLAGNEKAVQQELLLFLISLPVAGFLAPTWLAFLLMTGSILFLVLVEVLNTAIEATSMPSRLIFMNKSRLRRIAARWRC
ncbi:diacylglycerol kinase [Brucella pinnipedialis M163/99/10]|nr:diacylglycerol kinase [Brucella pinnipedialis M163/99/10]